MRNLEAMTETELLDMRAKYQDLIANSERRLAASYVSDYWHERVIDINAELRRRQQLTTPSG